ncbi:glycoside hydrolase superfamily [Tribonema minus]|uniref:Glycoside hydrolase superfamily n=1 Tax=Tribonema minus TaxID=303371 RepID=A0A836CFT8_9STRA|nr:glycoside hydrolase superfamily [Tribonema minus]
MAATAAELFATMGTGINLGNTLDNAQNNRDTEVIARRLTALRQKGFQHVRIPVTWQPMGCSKCRVNSPSFVALVEGAVNAAIALGFTVILNAHHEAWLTSYDGSSGMNAAFADLWRKVALHFKSVPQDKLLFELLNEPQGTMCPCTPAAQQLTRTLNATGYNAVRAISPTRIVLIQPNNLGDAWAARATYRTPSLLPGQGKDKYLAITVHSYGPPKFALPKGSNAYFLDMADPEAAVCQHVKKLIAELLKLRLALGSTPVHLGEFGVGRENLADRDAPIVHLYYRTIAKAARDACIPPTVWDDGTGNDFEITNFDRNANCVDFTFDLAGDVLGTTATP